MIRHVLWKYQQEKNWKEIGGRLGIYTEDSWIEIKQLAGVAPPAEILYELLRILDLAEFRAELQREPYLLECREKTSGAQDFLKRVLRRGKFLDAPIVASVHVSMFGKLNEGVRGHVNDLLLFVDEFPNVFGKNLKFYNLEFKVIEEDELFNLEDFIYPE